MNKNYEIIRDFARLRTSEAMSRVVEVVKAARFGPDDLYRLADAMARSGRLLDCDDDKSTADLASTGGPGSLSTLLGPLYLRAHGLLVPKLAVPGRPAGGIDVLAQLHGYKINLTAAAVREVLTRCGYVHFVAGEIFAPLDAALFRYRQAVGAQDVPALAIASLLAKKIACSVKFAGVDVRVAPHGNFGATFEDARRSARIFCNAARLAGIAGAAILTDARTPYQPFIGRGEALLAMKLIFDKKADDWLAEHDHRCRLMAAHTASLAGGTVLQRRAPEIERVFFENIEAQGSSFECFEAKVDTIASASRHDLTASCEGFFRLDIAALRLAFADMQPDGTSERQFPDELGLILRTRPGAYVERGDILASVRTPDVHRAGLKEHLAKAFQVVEILDYVPGVEEVVRA